MFGVMAVGALASAYGAYASAQGQRAALGQQGALADASGRIGAIQAQYQGETAAVLAGYQAQTDAVVSRIRGDLAAQQVAIDTQDRAFSLTQEAAGADRRAWVADMAARGAEMRQQAAEFNAWVSERAAQTELEAGAQAGAAQSLQAGQVQARQRTAQAASGIDLGTGSAAEVRAGDEILRLMDFNQIEANAARAAWGHRVEKANYLDQSRIEALNHTGLLSDAEMERMSAAGLRDQAALARSQGVATADMLTQASGQQADLALSRGQTAAWLARATGGNTSSYLRASGMAQGIGYQNQAAGISPWAAAGTSLLGSAGSVASSWYMRKAPPGYSAAAAKAAG